MAQQSHTQTVPDTQTCRDMEHAVAWATLFPGLGVSDWDMYDAVYDVSVSQVRRLAESELEVDA